MNLYSLPTDWQARTLPSLLARWPKLLALYHFGSTATGQAGPNSDADLAVLLPGQADILALWDEAQTLTGILGRSVDLIDLNPALVLEAVRRCRASLKKPPKSQEEYLDTLLKQGLPETVALLRQWMAAF